MTVQTQEQGRLLCVVGPTASGKSALAVALAEGLDGEILSCDSMQLYRGMDIGTAKAAPDEQKGIVHHFLDILDIHEAFSVSDYVTLAEQTVTDLYARHKTPIFCGGTGLYVDSFVSGMSFEEQNIRPGLREELTEQALRDGEDVLHARLAALDPVCAAAIQPQNVKRVVRALEICLSTGEPMSVWQERARQKAKPRNAVYICLSFADRQKLYERIDQRVDSMMANGLLEEAESLFCAGLRDTPTAGQAIGYKEFYPYFDGNAALEECVERLKINSRHYAKRQLTWFGRNKAAHFLMVDEMSPNELLKSAFEVWEHTNDAGGGEA